MANTIVLAQKFLPFIDLAYKKGALTSRLDSQGIQFTGANTVKVFKAQVPGFGDYSRANGFPTANYNSDWESLAMQYDRGVSIGIDRLDNEEVLGEIMGTVVNQFMTEQEIPEIDAVRFAKMASWSGVSTANADITVGTTDVPAAIELAEQTMGDNEVPEDGRILYVSNKCYSAIKAKITRILANENGVQTQIETYDGMPVVRVPQGRFNTAVTLNDGTANFGFAPTAGGYKINFMIVHPSAVVSVVKHDLFRIFDPSTTQQYDGWKIDWRLYHGLWVLDNKKAGIYVHRASTANS